jgi:hypothetical protein
MFTTTGHQAFRRIARGGFVATSLLVVLTVAAGRAHAQEAIGVPFIGNNHLAFYTTELSRDGVGKPKASIFGAIYGHRFGDQEEGWTFSLVARAGARALENSTDGILDTNVAVAASRRVPGVDRLSVTASTGVGAMAWGQGPTNPGAPQNGHLSLRVPTSAGLAYDLHMGRATVAPFAALTTSYSSERDYVNDVRTARDGGWRVGTQAGVSVRFRETVMSLSEVTREHGLPTSSRVVFTAGMSW